MKKNYVWVTPELYCKVRIGRGEKLSLSKKEGFVTKHSR